MSIIFVLLKIVVLGYHRYS